MLFALNDTTSATNAAAGAIAASIGVGLIFLVVVFVILMIPYYFIIKKAGYNGWLCLLAIVPLVNFVMLYVFAFSDWPALRGNSPLGYPPEPLFPTPPPGSTPFGSNPPSTFG